MQRVIVEISPDGFIRVFADQGIGVFIVNLPKMSLTHESEILSEEWAEVTMPRVYREIYCDARRLVKVGNAACPTVADLARGEARIQVLSTATRNAQRSH